MSLRVPNQFELAEALDRVLNDWAFLAAEPAGKPVSGPAPLPLEFSVDLAGSLQGRLTLRSSPALGAEIAFASTGDPGARAQGEDAFREFCNLAASHLMTRFLSGSSQDFKPFVPYATLPGQWPTQEPASECVLLVEGQALEARLWLDLGAAHV